MAASKRAVRTTASPPSPAPGQAWGERLTRFAFYMAIILACARATLLEILRDPILPAPGIDAGAASPGPTITLLLNWLFCVPALLVLARRAIDGTYVVRWSWMHAVMGALALWMLLSPLWAADRFAALVNATTFASALVLLWAMIQLVRSPLRLRFVAGAATGLLLVYVASGMHYRLVELPEMRKDWELNREQHLRNQGIEPGSFQARQFEQKLLRGDVGRFANSPNSYAAVVVMLAIVAAGAGIQRIVNRDSPAWLLPILIALGAAAYVIYHTQSRLAMLTPMLAVALLAAVALARHRLAMHARKLYWAGATLFLLAILAVAGHGSYHGSLPDKSMTFRWYYWTGAARILQEHPALGVGWSNFGLFYPSVRVAEATEQVKDPHNLFVRFFVELGMVGGLLCIVWLGRTAWELFIPVAAHTGFPPGDATKTTGRPILKLALLAFAAACASALFSIDLSQSSAYITLQLWEKLIGAFLLLLGFLIVVFQSLRDESLDVRSADWIVTSMIVAVAIFLLHNLIDFSLFETAPLTIFAFLCGSALGMRHPSVAGRRRKPLIAIASLTAGLLLWLGIGGMIVAPIASAETEARHADRALRTHRPSEAARRYLLAREAFPSNAEYSFLAAHALAFDAAPPSQVQDLLAAAIGANPRDLRLYVFRANYLRRLPDPDLNAVRADFERALALDPRDVNLRLEFADALAALGDKSSAAAQYRDALRHDDSLPKDEPKRLSPGKRGQIEQKAAASS